MISRCLTKWSLWIPFSRDIDMRTKSSKKNKINVVTLGCSKNLYDSEVLMGQLKANNKEVVHEDEEEDGNIVVINTCGFIGKAKEESVDAISTLLARAERELKVAQERVDRLKWELEKARS